jgi:5-methylcytosine-specific restriction endonuclease McrA
MDKYRGLPFYPTVDGFKICNVCEEDKPISEFKVKKASGLPQNKCSLCASNQRKLYAATEGYKRRRKEYRERTKQRNLEYQRAWRSKRRKESPPEKVLIDEKQKEKYRESSRRIRALKLGLPWESYTESQVIDFYGYRCYICLEDINLDVERRPGYPNWRYGLHIDHVIPMSKGGSDTLNNVRPVHGGCNLSKGPRNPSKYGD